MKTHFASPRRSSGSELRREIEIVSGSPVVSGLLNSVGGLLAVLDENRQIVSVNDSFAEMLGLDDSSETLGLRPGEALKCIHAHDQPAGCGTTEYCSTCGAAISIVTSLGKNAPAQRICALTTEKENVKSDLAFLVRSQPIDVNGNRFVLLFLQDITQQQFRASLERTFFHDINNMIYLLMGTSELLAEEHPSETAASVVRAANRLRNEVEIQRVLLNSSFDKYTPAWHRYSTEEVINELEVLFLRHPASKNKEIEYGISESAGIMTDISLLLRGLSNMLINALEATDENGKVGVSVRAGDDSVEFSVWNSATIPADVRKSIFQRNFSTKNEPGRGIGTYSMKLLGDNLLKGKVDFTSTADGTEFTFTCDRLKD